MTRAQGLIDCVQVCCTEIAALRPAQGTSSPRRISADSLRTPTCSGHTNLSGGFERQGGTGKGSAWVSVQARPQPADPPAAGARCSGRTCLCGTRIHACPCAQPGPLAAYMHAIPVRWHPPRRTLTPVVLGADERTGRARHSADGGLHGNDADLPELPACSCTASTAHMPTLRRLRLRSR